MNDKKTVSVNVFHILKSVMDAKAKKLNENGVDIITILPDNKGNIAQKYIKNKMKIIVKIK